MRLTPGSTSSPLSPLSPLSAPALPGGRRRASRLKGRVLPPIAVLVAATLALAACGGRPQARARSASPTAAPTRTSAAGVAAAPPAPVDGLDVRAENAKSGTPDWRLTNSGTLHAIEGFATVTDLLAGRPLRIAVSTTAASYRVRVFRFGWYGGALAHEVAHTAAYPGIRQAAAGFEAATDTVTTNWRPTVTLDTTAWVPGAYMARLDASSGAQHWVPFTVRSPAARGALVLMNAVTTWQAYNAWGGYSLYHGPAGGADFDHRSRVVSFDRPYDNAGDADFTGNELPAVALAEKLGLPLAYATDIDLHADAGLLTGARGLVSLGHDEYWSRAMRAAAVAARSRGVNIAFLGANAVFRHIRLEPGPVSDGTDRAFRREVCYKRPGGDPLYGRDNADVTVDWREPPTGLPESTLTGVYYECNPVMGALRVTDPGSWLWAGLAPAGTVIPGVAGSEYDRVNPGVPTPAGIEVLTHSPVTCRGIRSYSDSAYYTVPSGAGVFDAGTSLWVAALSAPCLGCPSTAAGRALLTAVTTRLLTAMAQGPLGRTHPAHGNLAALHAYPGDPIAARVNAD